MNLTFTIYEYEHYNNVNGDLGKPTGESWVWDDYFDPAQIKEKEEPKFNNEGILLEWSVEVEIDTELIENYEKQDFMNPDIDTYPIAIYEALSAPVEAEKARLTLHRQRVKKLAGAMISWGLTLAEDHHDTFFDEEEHEGMTQKEWWALVDDAISEADSWGPGV